MRDNAIVGIGRDSESNMAERGGKTQEQACTRSNDRQSEER